MTWRECSPAGSPHQDEEIEERVAALAAEDWVPGLTLTLGAVLFAEEVARSVARIDGVRLLATDPLDGVGSDPADLAWDAWRAIVWHDRCGDKEEATWLAFLATHFGRREGDDDPWRSTRAVYSAFGEAVLSWERVVASPTDISKVCQGHADECRRLKFANHRKFETPRPGPPLGVDAVLRSYVEGIIERTGGSQAALFSVPNESPAGRFERLMRELRFVKRFGRTALFDLLTLLGNFNVYDLTPGRVHLVGATGPLRGAKTMFGGADKRTLEARANEMARRLDIPIQAVEDALCNWQKHPKIGG
jgi:Alpha-glutamyl/putrescinyl thymine pyrophosphorylase clade 3